MTRQRKRITIQDSDPHKEFKLEIIELIRNETNYTVHKMLIRVLIWALLLVIPTIGGWSIVQYKQTQVINEIESNRSFNDSIISQVSKQTYEAHIDKQRLDKACEEVQLKADKTYVDDIVSKIDKEFDRTRHFENEMLKRQDLMLKHLLDLKATM